MPVLGAPAKTVVLSGSEFSRIKSLSKGPRPVAVSTRQVRKERGADRIAKQKAHVATIRSQPKPSDLEIDASRQDRERVTRAQRLLLEEEDDVKAMREIVNRAKVMAVRDAQVADKLEALKRQREVEAAMDAHGAEVRIAAMGAMEAQEAAAREERRRGASQIREQIADRERARQRQRELTEQEADRMKEAIKAQQRAEAEATIGRRERQQALRSEMQATNAAILEEKRRNKARLRAEDESIAQFNRDKAQREEEFEQQRVATIVSKERAFRASLENQVKVQDDRELRDALIAKRAAENYEREWRAKESKEAQRRCKAADELRAAHRQQMREKDAQLEAHARREREDFERVLAVQRALAEAESEAQSRAAAQASDVAAEMKRQISMKERRLRQEKEDDFDDGGAQRLANDAKLAQLEAIRREKLAELRALGVPDTYHSELKNYVHSHSR